MKTALIITTYNWKEALNAVLNSVMQQTQLPDQVIIADDGSREDTQQLIQQYQSHFPVPLLHSWQKDQGFRAAASRNKAIALSDCEYLIIIDGDMVLDKNFIASHKTVAKKNQFVQGGRVLTDPQRAQTIINDQKTPHFFSSGLSNRHNSLNNSWLSQRFSKEKNTESSTRSCNMAFWRSDVIECNGFNEDFVGWGREDSEFVHRMLNLEKTRLYLKFAGIAYHLHHNENSRASLAQNDEILAKTISQRLTYCPNGIDKYLD